MLVICYRGGLGNQLFQYAFGRCLAEKCGSELGVNRDFYTAAQIARGRKLDILKFKVPVTCEVPGDWTRGEDIVFGGKALEVISEEQYLADNSTFDRVISEGADFAITGFWQIDLEHLKTKALRQLLTRELAPKPDNFSQRYFDYKNQIAGHENGVAVHVRRGDYLSNTHMFCILRGDYYGTAVQKVTEISGPPKLFVFSDDIDAVAQEGLFDGEVTYVRGTSPIEDFQLMRNSNAIIAANSTFSWWAAYLSEDPECLAVLPRKYHPNEADQAEYEDSLYAFGPNWVFV